jgi:glyoxylase I family protein
MKFMFEVRLKPGRTAEDYADAWVRASEVIQHAPGARGTRLHRKIGDPTTLLEIACWESKAARDAREQFLKPDAAMRAVLDGPLDIADLRLIGEFEEPEWSVTPGVDSCSTAASPAEPLRILGLDHIYLAVSDIARSEAFYDGVMRALGFRKGNKSIAGERHAHYFNPFLQLSIRPARSVGPHDPYSPGLHHLCFQAADEAGVDETHARLAALGIVATHPCRYTEYVPDYYATFFEDPDGIRLEVVARTPHRETIARRWSDFRTFLNPVAELTAREAEQATRR